MTTKIEKSKIVGNDKDNHGCIGSAGYTWSAVKNECVRIFDGTRLNHYSESGKSNITTVAYVVFDDTKNKAELFLDTQKESVILERKSDKAPWINGDFELTFSSNEFKLTQAGKLVYVSN